LAADNVYSVPKRQNMPGVCDSAESRSVPQYARREADPEPVRAGRGITHEAVAMGHPVKALSIQQPWAWAILYSTKRVENRTWPTKFRGTFAIHAGKKYDRESAVDLEHEILAVPEPRPPAVCGAILGTARIVDCVRVETLGPEHLAWAVGPWCFMLDDVRAFAKPIPYRGALGILRCGDELKVEYEVLRYA